MSKKQSPKLKQKNQFQVISSEDLMTKSYGPKGSYTREIAEIKIKAIAQNISHINSFKENNCSF